MCRICVSRVRLGIIWLLGRLEGWSMGCSILLISTPQEISSPSSLRMPRGYFWILPGNELFGSLHDVDLRS